MISRFVLLYRTLATISVGFMIFRTLLTLNTKLDARKQMDGCWESNMNRPWENIHPYKTLETIEAFRSRALPKDVPVRNQRSKLGANL